MKLTGRQILRLRDVLKEAFLTENQLDQMVLGALDEQVRAIAEGGNLTDLIFDLIIQVQSRGKLNELLRGAVEANPGSTALQDFYREGLGPHESSTISPGQRSDPAQGERRSQTSTRWVDVVAGQAGHVVAGQTDVSRGQVRTSAQVDISNASQDLNPVEQLPEEPDLQEQDTDSVPTKLQRSQKRSAVAQQFLVELEQDPELALLVARSMVEGCLQYDEQVEPIVEQLLRQAIQQTPMRVLLKSHKEQVSFAAYATSGDLIVTASRDRTAKVWEQATGKYLFSLEGHGGPVTCAQFSRDNRVIITASSDRTVRVWDAATGKLRYSLPPVGSSVNSVAFSPDGLRIAAALDDGTLVVWSRKTKEWAQYANPLRGHRYSAYSVAFSQQGRFLVTAGADGLVKLWDARSLQLKVVMQGHVNDVMMAQFSPDERSVVSVGMDGHVIFWDVKSGSRRKVLELGPRSTAAATYNPSGSHVAVAMNDGTIRRWDISNWRELPVLRTNAGAVTSVAYHPVSDQYILGATSQGLAIQFGGNPEQDHTVLDLRPHAYSLLKAAYSPNGELIAVCVAGSGAGGSSPTYGTHAVQIWEATTHVMRRSLKGHTYAVHEASFHPDGTRIVTASQDQTARIWEVDTTSSSRELRGHTAAVLSASYSPGAGHFIVTASRDKTARIWDAESGSCLKSLTHKSEVRSARYRADGQLIVTACSDGTAWIWTPQGKNSRILGGRQPEEGHAGSISSAAFSNDGRLVATVGTDGTVRLWNAKTGAQMRILGRHTREVHQVVFSPDGKDIATASSDKTARIWDVETGQIRWTFQHAAEVIGVAYRPDGRRLLTVAQHPELRLYQWILDLSELTQMVNPRVGRDLTREEMASYLGGIA